MSFHAEVSYIKLGEILLSWAISPFVALLFAFGIYNLMEKTLSKLSFIMIERILRILLLMSSFLIAYNTGANELATVLGPVIHSNLLDRTPAFFFGAVFVFLGAFFLSYRVIETIGKGITAIDPYSGFAAQFGAGCTVMFFTFVGMPISTTYCIIGAISGAGLVKSMGTVNVKFIKKVFLNWILAPLLAFILSYVIAKLYITI